MANDFSQNLRSIILNSKEPFVIKDTLNWNILRWDLDEWCKLLNQEEMEFRSGKYESTKEPQWERHSKIFKCKFSEFANANVKNTKQWLYFDYKYLRECLKNAHKLQKSVSWEIFGFPEYNSEESTIWIGSEAAHTPCHKDTYGCNLVAQIFGRKRWIMFPPEENLCPTRIPYEESSIYSKFNFFSPHDLETFENIQQCKSIVLEPGEVLFVPNGWWHYVENMEMAISINIWIPLPRDSKNQLKESLVQMLISQIIKDLSVQEQQEVLNPNMEKLHLDTQNVMKSAEIINLCQQNCNETRSDCLYSVEELFKECGAKLYKIPDLSKREFITLLQSQAERFPQKELEVDIKCIKNNLINIIDAITSEDVINVMADKLLSNKL